MQFLITSLQYAKIGGGRPSPFYHVNDVSVYLGRQRGGRGPRQKNELDLGLVL